MAYESQIRFVVFARRAGARLAGGQIGVRDPDGRWSAAVFARNLFNTKFVTAINNNGSYQTAWLTSQAMRTVGVVVDGKF